jgi:sigma-B regulation protein RsbU (phosphoserine phosphatase)
MEKYGWICSAGIPLKNAAGETFAFVLADITLGHVLPKLAMFTLQYTVALAVLILAFGWFMLRYMNRNIVKPINDIAQAAQTYVRDKREDAQTNDHFARLDIHTGDEIENLSIVMSEMEEDLVAYEDNLTKVTAEKQRIGTELELATRIQADMLPNIFPAFPERQEFTIYASMTPAKEVGGDFYDFFFVDQDRLAMVIADVSGKGIPAAMFMMMAKSMIQTQAASGRGPREVLETVNHLICQNNREEMFVTVWFAILDLNTGILNAANAGHEFPILKKPGGCFEIFKDKHGFVIGGMDGVKYREYEIRLEPGARLFVYTDGVAEATSADKELFGMDRAVQALNDAADQSPEGLLRAVNAAVSRFVGAEEQFDDLTMLCIEYRGKEENR